MSFDGKSIKRFHVMAKPIGDKCNLDCQYCYYLKKSDLLDYDKNSRMDEPTLELFISQYIEAHNAAEIIFTWQGGEPTLLGLDYFKLIVKLQNKYKKPGTRILNDLQTNGINLTADWCAFLKKNAFLVGISIDGPQQVHDHYRTNKAGRGSFKQVMKGVELLHEYQIPFATLTCVSDISAKYAVEIYRFLRDEVKSKQIQFTPVVEHTSFESIAPKQQFIDVKVIGEKQAELVTPWSVNAKQWGRFLCCIFDEWFVNDVGKVHVVYFEQLLKGLLGYQADLCTHAPICGKGLSIETNGDIFSCDHLVYSDYRLGNINNTPLKNLAFSQKQENFGTSKRSSLTEQCRTCQHLTVCYGECPKNRIGSSINGEPGHSYLCDGWYQFYSHSKEPLLLLVKKLNIKNNL